MASSKTVRRLAFAAMFQLDARNGADVNSVRDGLAEDEPRPDDLAEAMKLALGAWSDRVAADRAMTRLAPAWPAHRQALADRAILRLGHFELTKGLTLTNVESSPPKVVINDLVALAKEYSTEKSPSFVNALLDKILKESQSAAAAKANPPAAVAPAVAPAQPDDAQPTLAAEAPPPAADPANDQSVMEGEG